MKPKRVECDNCKNFIDLVFKDPENLMSDVKTKAKCKLGNRVMFRINECSINNIDYGYFRYCNEFIQDETKNN